MLREESVRHLHFQHSMVRYLTVAVVVWRMKLVPGSILCSSTLMQSIVAVAGTSCF